MENNDELEPAVRAKVLHTAVLPLMVSGRSTSIITETLTTLEPGSATSSQLAWSYAVDGEYQKAITAAVDATNAGDPEPLFTILRLAPREIKEAWLRENEQRADELRELFAMDRNALEIAEARTSVATRKNQNIDPRPVAKLK